MARKFLFTGLAIATLSSAVAFLPELAVRAALAYGRGIDAATRQQVLAATVQMTLLAPVLDGQGQPVILSNGDEKQMQFQVGEGLGTLVRVGRQMVVVTHDHWSLLSPRLAKARFYSAANELLLELDGQEFLGLVRYRDGGTMVLEAPAGLRQHPALTPAPLGDARAAGWGEVVAVAYRQRESGAVTVKTMVVTSTADYLQRPSYELRSDEGTRVVPGNSGGGVWQDGRLVGSMWTTVTFENQDSGAVRTSSLSRAAQLPAGAW